MGRLDGKLRARWDALIETDGKAIGLTECRPFLENKMVNDIFYEGKFKGRDCIVKCSSKAPDSILNEFTLSGRVFAADPSVTPEPLTCRVTDDGRMAFIVTAKVSGPSLTERAASGISEIEADSFVSDILRLADALKKTGVVHRDLFSDNLLLDSDGHLKAIDFQFAVDRDDYRECGWMQRNWKYRYVVFGVNHDLGLGVWNDAAALSRVLIDLPQTESVKDAVHIFSRGSTENSFCARPGGVVRFYLFLYAQSLRMQLLFRSKNVQKTARIESRLSRILGVGIPAGRRSSP